MTLSNAKCIRPVAAALLISLPALASTAAPAPVVYDGVVRSSLYVPVRDGTRLAVNIYRPAVAGVAATTRFPAIFSFTPYRARWFDKDRKIVELVDQDAFALRRLVKAGYVVATADVRGKGASFGSRRGFLDQTEARDGHDLIQWLAKRPYTDGKVGIIGCSYLGGTAMLVAGTLPPALKAVFAAATDIDKYAFVRQGGITAQFNTRPDEPPEYDLASVPVDADTDGRQLKAAVAEHARNTPMAALWQSMPYRDSVSPLTGNRFWQEVGPYTHLKALRSKQLAWYFWSNWSDEPTEQMIQAAANVPSKLVVGPGGHCAPSPSIDIAAEPRRFFDRYLKGIDNGIDREPRYTWLHETPGSTGTIVRSDKLPGVGAARTSLFLSTAANDAPAAFDNGSLKVATPPTATTGFRVDYDVAEREYFRFWPAPLDGKGLTFTSAPLAAPASIEGYPVVHLTVAIDAADANIFAYLEEVDPAGAVAMLAFGRLAASHRKLAAAPYARFDLPFHSGLAADVAPMVPGTPATLSFALSPRAYTVPAGHRLRVTIAGADPRQRNLAQIRDGLARHVTLATGGSTTASRIDIPFTRPAVFR